MAFSFFVVGAGRSGTSLLASMIDAHPHLTCGMEVASVNCLSGNHCKHPEMVDERLLCLERACLEASLSVKNDWGNKVTTEQIAFLDDIAHAETVFFQYFKTEKIVYVLRDGRSCVASKMKRMGKSVDQAIASWRRSLHMLDWLRAHAADRFLEIRFEDLLSDTETVLTTVAQFLGQPYHSDMLKGPENPIMPDIYKGIKNLQVNKAYQPPFEDWHVEIRGDLERYGYFN
ncbi:MAG: sulfotransferase [Cryomorphaceae bacterium]|nr:sulfotransferase [Cryomorphaceae bacterium]